MMLMMIMVLMVAISITKILVILISQALSVGNNQYVNITFQIFGMDITSRDQGFHAIFHYRIECLWSSMDA